MNVFSYLIAFNVCSWSIVLFIFAVAFSDEIISKNQGKRFGEGWPHLKVEQFEGIPPVRTFIYDFIFKKRPLLLKGAAKLSSAFYKWSDEYFLSLNIPPDNQVFIETVKKENRSQQTGVLHFQEFVRTYNASETYMVDTIPEFLRQDVIMPCPLRCSEFQIVDSIMWYSSGGTKSVVHTDSVDNLNCLYRGRKHVILVDSKHSLKVDLDHAEGSYSSVDVDSVDYVRFPGLAEVEYYNMTMEVGDCLYIPYLWVHQVRSYGSNLAVNMWWDHFRVTESKDLSECMRLDCSETVTLKDTNMSSNYDSVLNIGIIRDRILSVVGVMPHATPGDFARRLFRFDEEAYGHIADQVISLRSSVFRLLDADRDDRLSRDEVLDCSSDDWNRVLALMKEIEKLLTHQDEKFTDATADFPTDSSDEKVELSEQSDDETGGKKSHSEL